MKMGWNALIPVALANKRVSLEVALGQGLDFQAREAVAGQRWFRQWGKAETVFDVFGA